jgi:hypothetical protein
MTVRIAVRCLGFATAFAGLFLVIFSMTASPWLRLSSNGHILGIRFSMVQDLVSTGAQTGTPFPTPTSVYFGWAGWILLGMLSIGAVLSGLSLPRTEVIAGITVAGALATVALLVAACRPLASSGVQVAVGAWVAGIGYLLLGVAAVLGTASHRPPAQGPPTSSFWTRYR